MNHGFYDDAAFFRVIPGFVVQFGLSADPAVNNVWRKSNFKDDAVTQSNKPGFITFATAGKDTRTTQLFINTGNNAQLDKMGFAPFGQVISGMDVVKKIHSGYGEAPDQGSITALGKPYLDKNFPEARSHSFRDDRLGWRRVLSERAARALFVSAPDNGHAVSCVNSSRLPAPP